MFEEEYGFTMIIEYLIKSKKKLIFHNGGYDLVFIY